MIARIFPDLLGWSSLLMLCSLLLFIEASGMFRALLATRQARWRFFLVLIPLTASIWSFANGAQALGPAESITHMGDLRLSTSYYLALSDKISMAIENCQLQTGIAGGAFIFSLLLEKVFHMPYVSFLIHSQKMV